MRLEHTSSPDGTRIAWRAPDSAGIPVLLSAPSLCTHLHWAGVEPLLAEFCRPIGWDYRGHGWSEDPADPGDYRLERVVEDLAAVHAAAAGDEPVCLCGLSLGGLVSLCYALEQPERVRALVLVNSGPGFKNPENRERWARRWRRAADKLESAGLEAYLDNRRAIAEILGRRPDSPEARRARDGVLHSRAGALAHFARGVAAPQPDLTGRLSEIDRPALVLVGAEDPGFQRAAEVFEARMPRARRGSIAAAGHPVPLDAPRAFAESLRAFLEELPDR
ncbi:MAG: alpha/beta fold hydrolase [Proteobacteria bacterium]|nr:alpha/beta fold hydrolase [Pseudomonadota bacterium]